VSPCCWLPHWINKFLRPDVLCRCVKLPPKVVYPAEQTFNYRREQTTKGTAGPLFCFCLIYRKLDCIGPWHGAVRGKVGSTSRASQCAMNESRGLTVHACCLGKERKENASVHRAWPAPGAPQDSSNESSRSQGKGVNWTGRQVAFLVGIAFAVTACLDKKKFGKKVHVVLFVVIW
jgi:hypothetical protein